MTSSLIIAELECSLPSAPTECLESTINQIKSVIHKCSDMSIGKRVDLTRMPTKDFVEKYLPLCKSRANNIHHFDVKIILLDAMFNFGNVIIDSVRLADMISLNQCGLYGCDVEGTFPEDEEETLRGELKDCLYSLMDVFIYS